jgi:predicted hotdog family 3-hydroxylacyl-ACP dehydratase
MLSTTLLFEKMLPHRVPMLMLSSILQQDKRSIHCSSIIDTQNPLLVDSHFPPIGGLELIAQASGVMLGENKTGQKTSVGVIARIKSLQIYEIAIPAGAELHIHARLMAGNLDAAMVEGHVMFNEFTFCSGTIMLATLPDNKL